MKKKYIGGLVAALMLLLGVGNARAIPLAVDMDPGTPGIQTSLSVTQGDSFAVDVVLVGDGSTTFDTSLFSLDYNDAGAILSLSGAPTAGDLAGMAPAFAGDFFGLVVVSPGSPLVVNTSLFPPSGGFASSSGGMGLSSLDVPFPVLLSGNEISIFSMIFSADAVGSSTLSLASGSLGGLALAGSPVLASLSSGSVSVSAVPEPGAFLLLGSALAGMFVLRRREGQK